ncbi:MAG: hypothetical protein Q8K18_04620 [Burkholderiales bacterium]|nr:hypothetical protein [Burkholderiales bacterium]
MKRYLVIFYTVVILLLLAGRHAWQNCQWEWISSIAAFAVIIATLIEGWGILRAKPTEGGTITLSGQALASAQISILLLCVGILIAGFGDVLGKWAFGCAG